MKYLLDTMVWLWSVGPTEKIGAKGLEILSSTHEEIYFSAASVWEMAIKAKLGKYELPEPPGQYIPKRLAQQGIRSLPVTHIHALKVYDLARHHGDPFDRLLIAQAIAEELTILTADRLFARYPVNTVPCGS
ncbi:MAG TPA: type II toxin-antitoxin system VapC family toxin [Candidatus Sulfotelmatobacter sp.]|nr:type II toxin-antitoxin system VapC family toxin [Candidatus Sulfotelmatobacter sp.]